VDVDEESFAPAGDLEEPNELTSARCEQCGGANASEARFCQHCGERLGEESVDQEVPRWGAVELGSARVVTALVCEPAAYAPPEVLGAIRTIAERHGGAVRDLPGSAGAMAAVFGPDRPGGDGPLRALRAAAEIREAFGSNEGDELLPGVLLRVGVGATEVPGEDPETEQLWAERVVDLAVRLQRMAEPGEVIVSEGVYRMVGSAATLQPVDQRASMDGDRSVGPLRLIDVTPGPTSLGLAEAPFLGREREVALLRDALERTVAANACTLVRLKGAAGLGKTRLGEEFLRALKEGGAANTVRARCRPLAEGGVTWPLAELIASVIGLTAGDGPEEARERIEQVLSGDAAAPRVAERLLPALGMAGRAVARETPWALRALLESAAKDRPLAVFIDDADRAGAGFDRLLRDLARGGRPLPILLMAAGSIDEHPNSDETVVELEPLDDEAMCSLVAALLGDPALPRDLCEAIALPCAGNPLIAEQFVAMLVGQGHLIMDLGRWTAATDPSAFPVPESFDELLAGRLHTLGVDERAAIGLVAVVGESFPWEPISDLVPETRREVIRGDLASLLRARLVREEPKSVGEEESFAFAHPLVREAALAEVPAEVRAQVHERYGRWLEAWSGPAHMRSPEVVGAHLASAVLARGDHQDHDDELTRRAVELLAQTAAVARDLGDARGAVALWKRASVLLPPEDPASAELLVHAGRAHEGLGETAAADALFAHAARMARTSGNPTLEGRVKLLRAALHAGGPDADGVEHLREVADSVAKEFREHGDDLGLAWAWSAKSFVYRRRGHWSAAADAAERAAEHARLAGDREEEVAALLALAGAIVDGRAPVAEATQRCERVLERVRGEWPAEQQTSTVLAQLMARMGSFDAARELVQVAAEDLTALGMEREEAACLLATGRVESLAGNREQAEGAFRRAAEIGDRVGDRSVVARAEAALAHVLLDEGRAEEAPALTEATEPAAWDDVSLRVEWRGARARGLAVGGRLEEADALARQAVKTADQTDLVELRAGALLYLADVLRLSDRPNEAAPLARRALRALERKGAEGAAVWARAVLAQATAHPEATAEGEEHEPLEATEAEEGRELEGSGDEALALEVSADETAQLGGSGDEAWVDEAWAGGSWSQGAWAHGAPVEGAPSSEAPAAATQGGQPAATQGGQPAAAPTAGEEAGGQEAAGEEGSAEESPTERASIEEPPPAERPAEKAEPSPPPAKPPANADKAGSGGRRLRWRW
jgi:tetratricopeptide (TPR) repeat protein